GEQKEARTQQALIATLQRLLDNRYFLLRNMELEGAGIEIPLILVGPSGVRVIYTSALKGVFRAREETWEKLDDRSQRFQIAQPNLLTRAQLMAQAVSASLAKHGFQLPEAEGAVYFSDPGIHVETVRPVVRVVLADALERYIASSAQSRTLLDPETVQKIVNALGGDQAQAKALYDDRDSFAFRDQKPPRPEPEVIVDRREPGFLKKIPFTSRQWMLLGVMTAVNIFLLAAFVILVLISS
ncbi:MAG TPA: NERD domain-containing protein, partial [Anaerolineales bacterium]